MTLREKIKSLVVDNDWGRTRIMREVPEASEWLVRSVISEVRESAEREDIRTRLRRLGTSSFEAILDLKPVVVRPLKTSAEVPIDRGFSRAVFLSDTHGQFVDQKALSVACQILEEARPDVVVHLGDLGDFYAISRYSKDPTRRVQLQDDIVAAAKVLGAIDSACPNGSTKLLLEGNHEGRMKKYIAQNAPELSTLPGLQIPSLIGATSLGWEYIEYDYELFPEFLVKHGETVRSNAGYTAHAEITKNWMSGVSGHTHRLGIVNYTSRRNHLKGMQPAFWIENGCLCEPEAEYFNGNANWQQGFSLVDYEESDGSFIPQIISIVGGKASFNGKIYRG